MSITFFTIPSDADLSASVADPADLLVDLTDPSVFGQAMFTKDDKLLAVANAVNKVKGPEDLLALRTDLSAEFGSAPDVDFPPFSPGLGCTDW